MLFIRPNSDVSTSLSCPQRNRTTVCVSRAHPALENRVPAGPPLRGASSWTRHVLREDLSAARRRARAERATGGCTRST